MRPQSLILRHVVVVMFCGTLIILSLQKHPSRFAAESKLFAAAQSGDLAQLDQALNDGARIDARDIVGMTPLMISAFAGHQPVVQLLLARGADLDACCDVGTPIGLAAFGGRREIVKLLLRHGARLEVHSECAATPLCYAIMAQDPQIVRMLIEAHADVNARMHDGATPLMIAAEYGDMEQGKLLLASGADPDRADNRGNTAESIATKAGHPEFVALLTHARNTRRARS